MAVEFQLERDRAYHRLVELFTSGAVSTEEPLSERKLADALQIGRTPIREALRDLAREGLVDVHPARGTFVKRLSLDDVRELYEIRHALEGTAAFLAAKHGATKALRAFRPVYKRMLKNPGAHGAKEIDDTGTAFHQEILKAARNRLLLSVYKPLRLRFQLAFIFPYGSDEAAIRQAFEEHLAILDAIEQRDAAGAQRLMCEHLTSGLELRMRVFDSLQGFEPMDVGAAD